MSACAFEYTWLDIGGDSDAPEILATFAQLSILFDDAAPLFVLDKRARTTRNFVVVPLYPLAEWIVTNWWSILNEPEVPSRTISLNDFQQRHSLRFAGDGYAFPPLTFIPEGPAARVAWRPYNSPFDSVEFLGHASAHVPTGILQQALADLVEAVLDRLSELGVRNTQLHIEWAAVQNADPDERAFCQAAGWLGIDPYRLPDSQADAILAASHALSPLLQEQVLQAAPPDAVASSVEWVTQGLHAIQNLSGVNGAWSELRSRLPRSTATGTPWEVGYQRARELRSFLGINDLVHLDLDRLTPERFPILTAPTPPAASFDGLIGTHHHALACYTAKRQSEAQRFLCARGLLSFLFDHDEAPAFYSSAQTVLQQRSRAFAAEFLAPAALIDQRLSGDDVAPDEIDLIAADFHVSTTVINHQIRNHHLGRIST
ncbi:MAG TPA: ImmA/IrrE family metallo-endopeptidase [Phycisphaerae bacterium]|nr:ImmA/IrrE family metallo-endopeptidase [Phycisphaerae bacterium]